MKKFTTSVAILSLAVVLGACGFGHQSTKSASSTSSKSAKASSKSKPAAKSASASSSSKASQASSQATAPTLTSLNAQVKQRIGAKTTTNIGVPAGQHAIVGYTGNAANYTVYYAVGATAAQLQATKLTNPTITISKQTFGTTGAAEAKINYQAPVKGLPTVNLGNHMTATSEGAAGSTYYTWYEGRWSVVLRSSNVNNEDGLSASKQAAAVLATEMLPIPAGHGAVTLSATTQSALSNTVVWREGTSIYTVSGRNDLQTLRAATSLN